MKALLTKRGVSNIATVFSVLFALTPIAAYLGVDDFRERKAIEKCVAGGGGQEFCEGVVAGMTKEEILDSIRDI